MITSIMLHVHKAQLPLDRNTCVLQVTSISEVTIFNIFIAWSEKPIKELA